MIQDKPLMENFWIDVHTHLHLLSPPAKDSIETARQNDIVKMITVGTSREDWPQVLEHLNAVYGALGCHPHEAKHYNDKAEAFLKKSLKTKGIVALGEIGLDYYYKHSEPDVQKTVFRRQMEIAKELNLPVEIHSRSAEKDTIEILNEYRGCVQGLLHCFTGSLDMAKKALDIGYNISFSGIVTFKNSAPLREVCSQVPLHRIHIETDAPYLAPVPHRGKQNQPAWLIHTAGAVGEIHKTPLPELKCRLWKNACELFSLINAHA